MKCAVCLRVACLVNCLAQLRLSLSAPWTLAPIKTGASSDDLLCITAIISSQAGQGVAPGNEVGFIPWDRKCVTSSYRKQSKATVPVSKMPQISSALCPTVKHCSSNDITVCHTFTLAIRFSLTLVAVSVMSPWYALTSAEMEVSQSNLTASSLCHSGECNYAGFTWV